LDSFWTVFKDGLLGRRVLPIVNRHNQGVLSEVAIVSNETLRGCDCECDFE